jgi:hypothetical protein
MNRGTQNAQMQGSQTKPTSTLDTGNFPWALMAEGDMSKDGLAKI